MEQVKAASGQVAVLKSANMSLGINLLMQLFSAGGNDSCAGRI